MSHPDVREAPAPGGGTHSRTRDSAAHEGAAHDGAGHTGAGHHHGHSSTARSDAGPDGGWHYTREFWDDRYGAADRLWSGQPNRQLVAQAAGLPPGHALDAGCGEGADAIWLAERGWTVMATDISPVAMARGAQQAAIRGEQIAARISWQAQDLLTWAPEPASFDLVSAQYLHLPSDVFDAMLTRLAAAVRPGGSLLVVLHHAGDLQKHAGPDGHPGAFRTSAELTAALDGAHWDMTVAVDDLDGHTVNAPDGSTVTVRDTVLLAVRRV
jgi:SAM-dependent methyltransferase